MGDGGAARGATSSAAAGGRFEGRRRGPAGERRGRGVGPPLDGALGAWSPASSAARTLKGVIRRTRSCGSASSAPARGAGRLVTRQRRRTACLVPRPSSARPEVRPHGDWRAMSAAFGRAGRAPSLRLASRGQRHGPAGERGVRDVAPPLRTQGLVPGREAAEEVSAEMRWVIPDGASEEDEVDSSDDGDRGTATPRSPSAPVVAVAATRTLKRMWRARCCASASAASARSTSKLPMSRTLEDVISKKQEIREAVELPLTHHELYCSMVL
ncbi:uncharacterized protein [Aegilops tauschii subsp. strangulata]|uniref:uncharacterized protein isoform X1 n=1 Tax=Aegilops tauschii subsp. strangulata TaxID=200361 RepID=UPI001ABC00D0|nr:uncharacterized protein LOC120974912 [Aegilops tauschii subsp. strangulata]XP_040257442.1 uncharacterized protein LOC120974912 [Aegilops tauschii subsp. strangulata]